MKDSVRKYKRVLGVVPSPGGLGFAVLEREAGLIDWGNRALCVARCQKNAACLKQSEILIEQYHPDALIIEDYQHKSFRSGSRIKAVLEDIAVLAHSKRVRVRKLSRSAVRKVFSPNGALNKHKVALKIAELFPELSSHMPPARKPWRGQDVRMSIFDAVALALMFFPVEEQKPLEKQGEPTTTAVG